ncbi:alpha/beta hydrolase [Mesorhizobium sp. SB112]|uniref:alpha/beta hydrolase n=1 Tax=Mesorhizobium sp. SB112 TaxID=3151853 RepID=UPI0032663241
MFDLPGDFIAMTENAVTNALGSLRLIEEGSWLRAQLNADYDARATVGERFADEMKAYRYASQAQRECWLRHEDVVYDETSGQTLDIYGSVGAITPQPVFLFIHGGYWRALSKHDSSMMTGLFAQHGISTAVMDYSLAPHASLHEIVRQVRAAVRFLFDHGGRFGLDRSAIHIGGSSAGSHLAASVLTNGWFDEGGLPVQMIRSAVLLSGLYELSPLAAAFPQEWLSLDKADVVALSPIRHLPEEGCPVLIAWAGSEPAGFKRQSRAFHDAWMKRGFVAQALEIKNRNHFDLLLDLGNADTALGREALRMIAAN